MGEKEKKWRGKSIPAVNVGIREAAEKTDFPLFLLQHPEYSRLFILNKQLDSVGSWVNCDAHEQPTGYHHWGPRQSGS